jgi:hypothetical protein
VKAPIKASERVRKALEADWTPLAGGAVAVCHFHVHRREGDKAPYHLVQLRAGDLSLQITVSPTGRSVRLHVNGDEVVADGEYGAAVLER